MARGWTPPHFGGGRHAVCAAFPSTARCPTPSPAGEPRNAKPVPQLAALYPTFKGDDTVLDADYIQAPANGDQLDFALVEHATPPTASPKRAKQTALAQFSQKKRAAVAR